jgi:acetylornithine deacetylase
MANQSTNHWITDHEQYIIEFLQQLLRIPSVTGNEGPIQAFLGDYLRNMGMELDVFEPDEAELRKHPAYVKESTGYKNRPNVVALWKGSGGGRSLLFNGHVDVIPEGPEENWQHPCWSAEIADGKMYGRGASDMKSGVAAMTMAIRAVKESGLRLKGDIIAEYVMDEELTGNGTLACVIKGYKADAGICCETSSMCVQPGSIGRIWFDIRVKGKAAGIQRRFEGVNAIDLGYIVTKAVSGYEEKRLAWVTHPLYPNILSAIPCMVGQFQSGSYNSAFPDSCLLKGSLATVPGENSDQVKADFVNFVQTRSAEQSPWLKEHPPEVIFTGYFAEPSSIPVESPIVQTLCGNFEKILGQKPAVSGREGAADIRFMNRYGNTPTVIFGPGRTEQMHANNEWVEVKDYINSVRILAETIIEWCGIGG